MPSRQISSKAMVVETDQGYCKVLYFPEYNLVLLPGDLYVNEDIINELEKNPNVDDIQTHNAIDAIEKTGF